MRRPTARNTIARPRARRGLTMVEIIVALSVFGAASLAMVGMSASVAKRGRETGERAKREAIVEAEVNRLMAIPYAQLTDFAGQHAVPHPLLPYSRSVDLQADASGARKFVRVRLIVAPTNGARPDTISFTRSQKVGATPLCFGCP